MPLLQIDSVSKRYATHTALDQVSLSIPENSIFGLLGPNGAGKTSLIRIINQITAPDSGSIAFDGQPLHQSHINEIGYLPEERGLYKKMEVGEQVMYLARLKGLSKEEATKRIKFWFEKFELQSWWKKKVEELSKGMQQKVQFITTVVHEPRLIILDEPFSGFDPLNANLIRDEILEIKRKGATIIFSTHRMETVEELCDHVALINRAKKVLDGEKNAIRQQFRDNTFELLYTGSLPDLSGQAAILEDTQHADSRKALIRPGANGNRKELIRLLNENLELLSFSEKLPTFNDIFIKTVKDSSHE